MRMDDKLYSLFYLSEERHWWFIGRRNIVLSFVDGLVLPGKRSRILDVGSGAGATLRELSRYGSAVGIDISRRAVDYCQRRGCRKIVLVGEEELPFPDNCFDLVVALDVIEHLEDDGKALAEYGRILKPGGSLLLTVPAYRWLWSWHDEVNHHRRRYSRRVLRDTLEGSGFTTSRLSYFSTYLLPLIVLVRLIEKANARLFNLRKEEFAFRIPGAFINRVLSAIYSSEKRWLRHRNFPCGSSILALARRQADE